MKILVQIICGLIISGLISVAAYWRRSLSVSGAVGAIIVGTVIWGLGGWPWGALLITFFILSSLLSHYKQRVKVGLAEKFDKGSRRDLGQVMANGGAGALIALAFVWYPHPALMAAFVGAMATVNADTWATELGVLSRRPPRLITTWKTVEVGTSGGISLPGTLATLAGALAIGVAAAAFLIIEGLLSKTNQIGEGLWFILPAVLGGLFGSLFDSLLGATVQAIYYSPARQKETEKRVDLDGTPNIHRRGWRWLTNDGVNFSSSFVGALIGTLVWILEIGVGTALAGR